MLSRLRMYATFISKHFGNLHKSRRCQCRNVCHANLGNVKKRCKHLRQFLRFYPPAACYSGILPKFAGAMVPPLMRIKRETGGNPVQSPLLYAVLWSCNRMPLEPAHMPWLPGRRCRLTASQKTCHARCYAFLYRHGGWRANVFCQVFV